MTFRGLHEHSLDPKDRITVPAKYRAALSDGVVLGMGVEPCVEIWQASVAEQMEASTLSALNPMSRDARRLQRRFFSHSESLDLDSAGRIRLSKQLIEHARLKDRCVITGMGTRLEIWTPRRVVRRGRGEREVDSRTDREPRLDAERLRSGAGERSVRW